MSYARNARRRAKKRRENDYRTIVEWANLYSAEPPPAPSPTPPALPRQKKELRPS